MHCWEAGSFVEIGPRRSMTPGRKALDQRHRVTAGVRESRLVRCVVLSSRDSGRKVHRNQGACRRDNVT